MELNQNSINKLKGIDSRLIDLAHATAEVIDSELKGYGIIITYGLRTLAEQKALVAKGASQTMKSYHLTGKAFDFAVLKNGAITWDFEEYRKVSQIIKRLATEKNLKITWGGDWKTLRDGPHIQIEN